MLFIFSSETQKFMTLRKLHAIWASPAIIVRANRPKNVRNNYSQHAVLFIKKELNKNTQAKIGKKGKKLSPTQISKAEK